MTDFPPTAPFLIQWAEGGPRGSQAVTLLLSLTGTPADDALLLRVELLSPLVIFDQAVSCGSAPTDDQVFTIKVDGIAVATVTIAGAQTQGVVTYVTRTWGAGVLTVHGPALISVPIADISMTFKGAQ